MIIYFIIVSSTCLSANKRLRVTDSQPFVISKAGRKPRHQGYADVAAHSKKAVFRRRCCRDGR